MRRKDNVILVAPQAELAAQEKAELEAQKDIQELAPLRTEFLTVNYAKATEIARLVKSAGGGSLLSERGNVTMDERTNTLLVQDTAENLPAIRSMVATLDIPVRQVLIEARIVIVADDFSRELGVRAGFTRVSDDVKRPDGGQRQRAGDRLDHGFGARQPGQHRPAVPGRRAVRPGFDRYNVNMPVANPAGRIALSILDFDDFLIDLELSAAQNEGRGEIKSTPRVITANQREAIIEQGVEIPYQESASSRRDDHPVQEGGAVAQGHAADHAGRPGDPRPRRHQGQRRPARAVGDRRLRALDRHAQHPDPGAREGRPDGRAGRHHGDGAPRLRSRRSRGSATCRSSATCSSRKTKINNRDELLIFVTPKILREGSSTE